MHLNTLAASLEYSETYAKWNAEKIEIYHYSYHSRDREATKNSCIEKLNVKYLCPFSLSFCKAHIYCSES